MRRRVLQQKLTVLGGPGSNVLAALDQSQFLAPLQNPGESFGGLGVTVVPETPMLGHGAVVDDAGVLANHVFGVYGLLVDVSDEGGAVPLA